MAVGPEPDVAPEATEPPETLQLTWFGGVSVPLGGALLGAIGAFLQAVTWTIGSVTLPVGLVLVLLTLFACNRALVHNYGVRLPGVLFLTGWVIASIVLALPGPGGDVVIAAEPLAMAYLALGVVIGTTVATIPVRLRAG